MTNKTNKASSSEASSKPTTQQQLQNQKIVFYDLQFFLSLFKYINLWDYCVTCSLLFKKYNKFFNFPLCKYIHCNLKLYNCNLKLDNAFCNHGVALGKVHILDLKTIHTLDLKLVEQHATLDLSYHNKITYVKKLEPYYTKKAKHFSKKHVFHHNK
jgi:hypothetical protein